MTAKKKSIKKSQQMLWIAIQTDDLYAVDSLKLVVVSFDKQEIEIVIEKWFRQYDTDFEDIHVFRGGKEVKFKAVEVTEPQFNVSIFDK